MHPYFDQCRPQHYFCGPLSYATRVILAFWANQLKTFLFFIIVFFVLKLKCVAFELDAIQL